MASALRLSRSLKMSAISAITLPHMIMACIVMAEMLVAYLVMASALSLTRSLKSSAVSAIALALQRMCACT